MSFKDELGTLMKEYYEGIPRIKLYKRMPVIIRLDGKAFHTFTKGFDKPFDEIFAKTMKQTAKALYESIQGCVFGYTQSDEISLVLVDYQNHNSQAWFDYEIQKMTSISASMAGKFFNKYFIENEEENFVTKTYVAENMYACTINDIEKYHKYSMKYNRADFDSRVFNLPFSEVTNYIYWEAA